MVVFFFLILVLSWLLSILKKSKLEVNSKGVKAKVLIRSTAVHWCVVFFHRKKGNRSDFLLLFIRGQYENNLGLHVTHAITLHWAREVDFCLRLCRTKLLTHSRVYLVLLGMIDKIMSSLSSPSCPPCWGTRTGTRQITPFCPPCQPPIRKMSSLSTPDEKSKDKKNSGLCCSFLFWECGVPGRNKRLVLI